VSEEGCPIKQQELEVRIALVERDSTEMKTEMRGLREQNKAHYNELRDGMTDLTHQVTRLCEGLEREGVYNVSREELEQKAKDRQFVRDMRGAMGELAKRTRNTLWTLAIMGGLALVSWFVGIKHPEIFK